MLCSSEVKHCASEGEYEKLRDILELNGTPSGVGRPQQLRHLKLSTAELYVLQVRGSKCSVQQYIFSTLPSSLLPARPPLARAHALHCKFDESAMAIGSCCDKAPDVAYLLLSLLMVVGWFSSTSDKMCADQIILRSVAAWSWLERV